MTGVSLIWPIGFVPFVFSTQVTALPAALVAGPADEDKPPASPTNSLTAIWSLD